MVHGLVHKTVNPDYRPIEQPADEMTTIDWPGLSGNIHAWAKELGFSAVGITGLNLPEHQQRLENWLAKGYHGEMAYMANHGDMRSRPEKLHPGTLTLISLRLNYLEPEPNPEQILASDTHAYISRYAMGRDYHKVIRARLKKLVARMEETVTPMGFDLSARVVTDSAPLLEKAVAEQAGLGWIGKNTLLLNEKAGSWFFLAEVLTNLPLPETHDPQVNRCGSCSACLDICPTDAFVAPYELDARRCISYLTIEHRGSIPVELRASMGNRVFGCDDCQMVCPWNRYAEHNQEDDFKPRNGLASAELMELLQWTEEEFLQRTEGSAIRRTGYTGWLRNLAVGIGNSTVQENTHQVLMSAKGQSDLVDEHIDWALRQLESS